MGQQSIAALRAKVTNAYGTSLSEKASDALCFILVNLVEAGIPRVALESNSARNPAHFVIEMSSPTSENSSLSKIRETSQWKQLADALSSMLVPEMGIGLMASKLIRSTFISVGRDSFLKQANLITEHIEKYLVRSYASKTESLSEISKLTQTCWLNQTVRVVGDPYVLAEVAADPKIKFIDPPRKLVKELDVTSGVMALPDYRQRYPFTGKGVKIGVIDSEVALSHPALAGRVIHRRNYTSEPWGSPDEHGTAVAGIIASNDVKFTGIAPEASIYNYKVLATIPSSSADDFEGSLALQHALEDGMDIVNCSWGTGPASDGTSREARACNAAWDNGLVIVKSAGNRGPGLETLTSPADATGIIVVAATDRTGQEIQQYSSRGPNQTNLNAPTLCAPGGSPMDGIISCRPGGGFDVCGHGTSFAAPHVTGLLALLLEENINLSPDELRNALIKLSTSLSGFSKEEQGVGFLSLNSLI